MYLAKTPLALKRTYPNLIWDIPNESNAIYLTFDDGPTPEVTEWTLNLLKQHQIKATFFVVGANVKKYPNIYQKIIEEGHAIGNHTQHHLNGWKTKTTDYINDVALCQEQLKTNLFRPPYGKIKRAQIKQLKNYYKIMMWDVLSGDFDTSIVPEKCFTNVVENTKSGSIIVFHDSIKAASNLKYALPKAIEYLKSKGFVFKVLG
ncbi:MAG: polysaccharide deacetylase family protein [Flavobacteriales bacterium]|nr:polysaccharide deacetylase family protein [Flavobacteriales bacterium]